MLRISAVLGAFILQSCVAASDLSIDRIGDEYHLLLTTTSESSGEKSSSSSKSSYTLTERLVKFHEDGVELEFDLPDDTSPEDRAQTWHFPARVIKRENGQLELLNYDQLENQVDSWLQRWEIPKEYCGQWIFTWTAIKIECDPTSVLSTLEAFDVRYIDLREGALFRDKAALASSPLTVKVDDSGQATYVATMTVDPNVIRRLRAEQSIITAEILGKEEHTLEEETRNQPTAQISGTITTTFETDEDGRVTSRTRVKEILTVIQDGSTEREIITDTLTRKLVKGRD